ncbi:MAG: pentapeptide repeat-containing protein [Acidimicrobiales bacterium]
MLGLVASIVLALSPAEASTTLEPSTEIASDEVARRAAAGEAVTLSDVTLNGALDLRPVGTVRAPFRCRRCHLHGSFTAADVVFERMLELSESTVDGATDFNGAIFRERGSFDGSVFAAGVNFGAASFQQEASFVHARFRADARFAQADFEGRADFFTAEFARPAVFTGAEFRAVSNFRLSLLGAGGQFDDVRADASLTFDGAVVDGEVTFDRMASPSLSLDGVIFRDAVLSMERAPLDDVRMDPRDVHVVAGPATQQETLRRIEAGATSRDDLVEANDARYERLALAARTARVASDYSSTPSSTAAPPGTSYARATPWLRSPACWPPGPSCGWAGTCSGTGPAGHGARRPGTPPGGRSCASRRAPRCSCAPWPRRSKGRSPGNPGPTSRTRTRSGATSPPASA